MYDENHPPTRPNPVRGLIPAVLILLCVIVTAAVLALTQPSGHQREAYIAPDTPAPTPGATLPVDAPASALV